MPTDPKLRHGFGDRGARHYVTAKFAFLARAAVIERIRDGAR